MKKEIVLFLMHSGFATIPTHELTTSEALMVVKDKLSLKAAQEAIMAENTELLKETLGEHYSAWEKGDRMSIPADAMKRGEEVVNLNLQSEIELEGFELIPFTTLHKLQTKDTKFINDNIVSLKDILWRFD